MRLPDFLIIGAAKCGTTTLHHWLGSHPEVFLPAVKEPRFFAFDGRVPPYVGKGDLAGVSDAVVDPAAYAALFDGAGDARAVGEASPVYLFTPGTADRVRATIPTARIVAVLRDPAERAFSSYLHLRRLGREEIPRFEEALAAETARAGEPRDLLWHYRAAGFYHRQLLPWFTAFPRDRIHVLLSEDLDRAPDATLAALFAFLGVDPDVRVDTARRRNVGSVPRENSLHRFLTRPNAVKSALGAALPPAWRRRIVGAALDWNRVRPRMDPATRAGLVAGFREDILALQDLLGRDLSAWLRT